MKDGSKATLRFAAIGGIAMSDLWYSRSISLLLVEILCYEENEIPTLFL